MMNINSKWLVPSAVALLAACIALPASAGWFSGGPYDGFDDTRDGMKIDLPQVNNAGGATNVTMTNAWLNGMLLYNGGAPATVKVYWGKTDGGIDTGSWSNSHVFAQAGEREPLTHQAEDLDSGATYYYRFYAINTASPPEEGWAFSSATFVTPSAPVVGPGAGALPVGRTSATLNGELTVALTADITFSWGIGEDPDEWDGGDSVTLDDRSEGPLRLAVTGLEPGTTYYYRIQAVNPYGEDDLDPLVSFTTVSGLAWFSGGSYDGYDQLADDTKLRPLQGTMFLLR